jgi:flagellar biosynthesis/type III secretory pathway M-ring protein FliF/YscJ
LKEIVALFNYLPFTNVNISILPITSENFLIYFIAFIVTFFLLGIIIGYIINPRRRQRNTTEPPLIEVAKSKQGAANSSGQDIPVNESEQQRRMDNQNQRNRNYYSNSWDYSKPTRRY